MRPAAALGEPSGPVVVSAHELAAGSILRPPDVRVVSMPDSLRPAGTLSTPESVDGLLLAGPARTGEPITDARLVGAFPGSPASDDPGKSVVPVRLADPAIAALLHPGARIDVVTGDGITAESHEVLASMAMVVAVTPPQAEIRHGQGATTPGPLILLELPTDVATRLAAASLGRPVAVTLR